jgi:hypothetical protein
MRLTKPKEKGSSAMEAQFDSRCMSCGERIREGDEIFRDDDLDAWVCEGCEPAPPAPLRLKAPPRPKKKTAPSLAERLEGKAAKPSPTYMTAHEALKKAISCIDGLNEEYLTRPSDWDAAADVLVMWAKSLGAR